jgi:hypothetical protein
MLGLAYIVAILKMEESKIIHAYCCTDFESDSSTLRHFIHRNMLRMKFIMGSLPG